MALPREDVVGSFVIGAIAVIAVLRAVTSRPFHVPGAVSDVQAHQVFAEDVQDEPGDRADAARRFRGSPWSQDDDFHSKEAKRLRNYAKAHDVSTTSLVETIDDGMRQKWSTPSSNVPNPKVMPCRPRLIY